MPHNVLCSWNMHCTGLAMIVWETNVIIYIKLSDFRAHLLRWTACIQWMLACCVWVAKSWTCCSDTLANQRQVVMAWYMLLPSVRKAAVRNSSPSTEQRCANEINVARVGQPGWWEKRKDVPPSTGPQTHTRGKCYSLSQFNCPEHDVLQRSLWWWVTVLT